MSAQKILIIEDDISIQSLYEQILKMSGFDVTTSSDGEDGLHKAQQGGYDLILLDIMLPKIDGLGILAALKKTPATIPNGPIVLLTNLTRDPIMEQAKGLGAQNCLTKVELNPEQLVQKVQQELAKNLLKS